MTEFLSRLSATSAAIRFLKFNGNPRQPFRSRVHRVSLANGANESERGG